MGQSIGKRSFARTVGSLKRLAGAISLLKMLAQSCRHGAHSKRDAARCWSNVGSGDPSPVTARGVFRAMQAAAKYRWGVDSLAGRTVAIQGCGNVGYYLASYLHADGARLIASDVDAAKVRRVVRSLMRLRSRRRRFTRLRPTCLRRARWRRDQRPNCAQFESGDRCRWGKQSASRTSTRR